jgi:hypothetical protein
MHFVARKLEKKSKNDDDSTNLKIPSHSPKEIESFFNTLNFHDSRNATKKRKEKSKRQLTAVFELQFCGRTFEPFKVYVHSFLSLFSGFEEKFIFNDFFRFYE